MASTKWLLVDDPDSRIKYNGNWDAVPPSQMNFGTPFENTLHGITGEGSFTVPFSGRSTIRSFQCHVIPLLILRQGSSLQVYGRVQPVSSVQTAYDCLVDNIIIPQSPSPPLPQGSWILCATNDLDITSHTLTIQVKSPSVTFQLDFFQYIPISNSDFDHAFSWVDNIDPSITYDGTWRSVDDVAVMTSTTGGKASVSFTGANTKPSISPSVSLTWFGYIPENVSRRSMTGMYTIDGGAEQTFSFTGPQDTSARFYNQAYFQTLNLSQGQHTLEVTFGGDSAVLPLTLDYLMIKNSDGNLNVPSSSAPASTADTTPTPGTPNLPPNTSSSTDHINASSKPPIGAIVGGVIGGLALIVLLALLAFFLRRRQQKDDREAKEITQVMSPYTSSPTTAQRSGPAPSSTTSTSPRTASPSGRGAGKFAPVLRMPSPGSPEPASSTSATTSPFSDAARIMTQSSPLNNTSAYSTVSGSVNNSVGADMSVTSSPVTPLQLSGGNLKSSASSTVPLSPQRFVRHDDSGIRIPPRGSDGAFVELPPLYTSG
ncbi:hypothetical protein CVT24_012610 [Panaeolus cyanescens]|uniref:Epidermal growth factor receptor-like transmembrane-juxtamembrane segment domain-containing protein n=1 Tax=Panaeolus cyanescens TaxID=181874 RepID=A0A409WD48_9AGAR|nr:hypothetical protein CVT24_012610 [Panaeolus cyanescens]